MSIIKPPIEHSESKELRLLRSINVCLILLLILALGYSVIYAKPILLPLLLAFLVTLVLKPVHRLLTKIRLPKPLAAALTVLLLLGGTMAGVNSLAMPAGEWGKTLDLESVERQVRELFAPVQKIQEGISDAAKKVDEIAEGESEQSKKDKSSTPQSSGEFQNGSEKESETKTSNPTDPVKVTIKERPDSGFFLYAQSFGLHATATLLLIFFFLAYGDLLHRKIADSDGTAQLFQSVTSEVSRYLFTITAINIGLGVCIGAAMWILGMPNALLWGVMAALFNFIPYLGGVAGSIVVFLVALVTFNEPEQAILIPLVYFGLTALEGNVVTPMIIGRHFALNPIAVVIWFMCWGAVWGIAGLLIATPTLMAFKIVSANISSMKKIDRLLSS